MLLSLSHSNSRPGHLSWEKAAVRVGSSERKLGRFRPRRRSLGLDRYGRRNCMKKPTSPSKTHSASESSDNPDEPQQGNRSVLRRPTMVRTVARASASIRRDSTSSSDNDTLSSVEGADAENQGSRVLRNSLN